MSRTVVRFQESNDGVTRFSLEYPKAFLQPNRLFDLLSRPDQPPFSDMRTGSGSPNHVQEAGRKLFDELSKHPAIAPAIAAALQQQQGGCSPICLRLDDSALADDLPWEAVCGLGVSGGQEFFALDERWPVVRMREVMETEPVSVYTLEPPLRITVVLSAAGRTPQTRAPARPQWDRVRETVDKHLQVNNPVQVKVTVFAGEEDLRNHIRDANLPWVTAGLIADQASFLNAIKDSRPQILHFFCHGTAEGIPHLRIGSYTDWEVEREPSIALTARELRQSADPDQNTWLVTLNCCESATRAADARSLASSLVAAGFPAALGMREAIEVQQAHLLCEFFYPKVMEMIRRVPVGGAATEIEWAKALSVARANFVAQYNAGVPAQEAAGSCKIWTIPALYTRREPFFLKRIAPAPPGLSQEKQEIIDYIRTLQQQRAKAAEDYKDLPPPALTAILNDLDNQIAAKTAELQAK
jgi:hypothetical protein